MEPATETMSERDRNSAGFRAISTPSHLCIPLTSHPSRQAPVVRPAGTLVAAGEWLTEAGAETAAAIAPRSGKIIGVSKTTLCNGKVVDAVEIKTLAVEAPPPARPASSQPHPTFKSSDLPHWIDRLLAAGVDASRVGCPDLIGQLAQCRALPIDTVLCCVLDSDPGLPINAAVARAFAAELAAGIDLMAKLLDARRVWIAADPLRPSTWFASLDPLIRADGLRLVPLRGDYPQADPTLLLHTLLHRRLRSGELPVEQGVLLLDAPAAVAIGHCMLHDRPSFDLPLALRDHVLGQTHFLLAPMGTSLADVCRAIDIPPEDVRFRGGDFLRDQLLPADAVIGPGELAIHVTARELPLIVDPCVRCGWCIEACPTRIHPAHLLEAAQRNDQRTAKKFGLDSCIECGICSYVCPSRLPLLAAIRTLKTAREE
jgi:electron transport complex protein RnfC